jgi:hypothetical protein
VRKNDMLRDLRYTLAFGAPRLLGVPWVRAGAGRADAAFGLSMGPLPAGLQ